MLQRGGPHLEQADVLPGDAGRGGFGDLPPHQLPHLLWAQLLLACKDGTVRPEARAAELRFCRMLTDTEL
jgi:hypothetical protein